MANSEFEVIWPGDKSDTIDDSSASQPDQRRMRLDFYDQLSFEGLEEEPVDNLSVSDIPTPGVANRLLIAARTHYGRQIG